MATNPKLPALLQPMPSAAELAKPQATPSTSFGVAPLQTTGRVRQALDREWKGLPTPASALEALRLATDATDIAPLMSAIERMKALNLNYTSARETISEPIIAAPLRATTGGSLARDKRIAEDVQATLLDTGWMRDLVSHLAEFDDYGFAAADIFWDTSNPTHWHQVGAQAIPPRWVTFDRVDGRTPLLLPAEQGQKPAPLKYAQTVFVMRPGFSLPVLRAHGYAGVFYDAICRAATADWSGLLEMHGAPMRVGTYDPNVADDEVLKEQQKVLKKALESIGHDAWAMVPNTMKIEFVDAISKGASADMFERYHRYFDELNTKRITGAVLTTGTGNTGSGGTQALGGTHSDATARKIAGAAAVIADAIRRDVVVPYVRANYGDAAPIPFVTFHFETAVDQNARIVSIGSMIDRGLAVAADDVREALNLRTPKEGDEVLGGRQEAEPEQEQAPPADQKRPAKAQNRAQASFSASPEAQIPPDELDAFVDDLQATDEYEAISEDLDRALLSAVESAGGKGVQALLAALQTVVKTGDVQQLSTALLECMSASRVAGEEGATIERDA
jgi:phage gp29-like protein